MKTGDGAREHAPTLTHALRQFELAEANLARLEVLWGKIEGEVPNGPAFGAPPEYDEWCICVPAYPDGVARRGWLSRG